MKYTIIHKLKNIRKQPLSINKLFLFWCSLETHFQLFHFKYRHFYNYYSNWSNELSQLCSDPHSTIIQVIQYIHSKISTHCFNIISTMDTKLFQKFYKKFKIWKKIIKKEESIIQSFTNNSKTSTQQHTPYIIQDNALFCIKLFYLCIPFLNKREKREKIFEFFQNIHDINFSNLRQLFIIASILKSKKIIRHIKHNYNLSICCKDYFNIDIDYKIKSKKLLEILTLINIYNL